MRALVTGAAGFVGRHLVEHLRSEGDEVLGVDRHDGPDLLDPSGLSRLVTEAEPDVIYHLAGWSDVGASWTAPRDVLRANAEGTLNVVLAARGSSPRVLVVSSADVYGRVEPQDLPTSESAPLSPVSPYAASKAAADLIALQAWNGFGVPTLRVRAFNHLGPGQAHHFVGPALAERVARNELDGGDVVAVGATEPRRDVTDVRDVVKAYRLLAVLGEPGEAYNVCSGVDVSVGQIAAQLVALADTPMRLVRDPALERPVEVAVSVGDPSKLAKATGWAPTIPLGQTLADVLEEWRNRVRFGNDGPPR